jgi:hypothetical protein
VEYESVRHGLDSSSIDVGSRNEKMVWARKTILEIRMERVEEDIESLRRRGDESTFVSASVVRKAEELVVEFGISVSM